MNTKFYVIIYCLVFVLLSQTSNGQVTSKDTTLSECETCDLVGEISRAQLENNATFNEWFSSNFENYLLNSSAMSTLNSIPTEDLSFKIIMGTWCSDSQRDVPRFARILEALDISESAIDYYALDADKLSPEKIEETYQVNHVPTFIIYKNGVELNRIVEMSIRTLEEDLAVILTTNDYQHIYAD